MKSKNSGSPAISTIDKRSNLSQKELFHEYIKEEKPVILTDAIRNWGAMGKITPQFFKETYPDISKTINGVTYKMSDFIDLMLTSTPEKVAPYPYNFNVQKHFPELLEYAKPEILYAKSDRVNHRLMPKIMFSHTQVYEIFLGGKGARWPTLHFDALFMHTQITQLYGSKTFFLYAPDQTPFLYPDPENHKNSLINVFSPDYDKYPLFRQARGIKVTVEEGETILFPKGWWHTTEMDGPCISWGRVQLNASNWKDFCNDNYKAWKQNKNKLRVPAFIYAKLVGHIMNIQEAFIF